MGAHCVSARGYIPPPNCFHSGWRSQRQSQEPSLCQDEGSLVCWGMPGSPTCGPAWRATLILSVSLGSEQGSPQHPPTKGPQLRKGASWAGSLPICFYLFGGGRDGLVFQLRFGPPASRALASHLLTRRLALRLHLLLPLLE